LGRLNKKIKRRSNVVGIFPNGRAVLRLVGAILVEQDDEWAVTERHCFSAESMTRLTAPLGQTTEHELPIAIAQYERDHEIRNDAIALPPRLGTLTHSSPVHLRFHRNRP
jgi:hypothetical protein